MSFNEVKRAIIIGGWGIFAFLSATLTLYPFRMLFQQETPQDGPTLLLLLIALGAIPTGVFGMILAISEIQKLVTTQNNSSQLKVI